MTFIFASKRFLILITAISSILFSTTAFTAQISTPYTNATRYDLGGQVTGTISTNTGSGFLATRNTYQNGMLVKVEKGKLTQWFDENVKPANWGGSFTAETTQVITYDKYGRQSIKAKLDKQGLTESLVQINYTYKNLVNCKATRLSAKGNAPASYGSLPDACIPNISAYGADRITQYTYGSLDQVLTEKRAVGTPLAQTYATNTYLTVYSGGSNSNLLKSQTDANGNKTELEYDDYKRLKRRYYPSKNRVANQSPTNPGVPDYTDYNEYQYDLNGNISGERKRNGKWIYYSYDNNNRMTKKDLVDNTYSKDIVYNYDLRGLTLYSKFDVATGQGITNSFDGFGRQKSSNIWQANFSKTLQYQYDNNGNRTRITHPDNVYFTYTFDNLNRLSSVNENVSDLLLNVNYHPGKGRRETVSRTGGTYTRYNFDDALRLSSFTQDLSGTAQDLTTTFQYNPASQITQLTYSNSQYHYQGNENRAGTYVPNGLNQYTRFLQ